MVETNFFLPRFKYDKSKAKEYEFTLTKNLGNLWVADSIGHLGADRLTNLLQQCVGVATKSTFGNKPLGRNCRKKHCHKPWFDTDYHMAKCELRFWLKTNPNLHDTKHQESKLKNLFLKKRILWEITIAQHMCALAKVDTLSF